MKNWHLVIVAGILLLACGEKETGLTKPTFAQFADSLFQTNIDSAFLAGAAILVHHKGETLLDKTYGFASLELAVPVPESGSFEIGSVTKQFTAAAILQLAEAGKLNLEDDFTKYLEFDTKGRMVTLNQL